MISVRVSSAHDFTVQEFVFTDAQALVRRHFAAQSCTANDLNA